MCIIVKEKAAMGRTNIVLDDELVAECKAATGIKTTKDVVNQALMELRRRGRQRNLLAFEGKVAWDGDLAEMRRGRTYGLG